MYAKLLQDAGPAGVGNYTWYEAVSDFQQGKAAMYIDASVFMSQIEDPAKSTVAGKVGYAPMPAGPKGAFANTGSWMLLDELLVEEQDRAPLSSSPGRRARRPRRRSAKRPASARAAPSSPIRRCRRIPGRMGDGGDGVDAVGQSRARLPAHHGDRRMARHLWWRGERHHPEAVRRADRARRCGKKDGRGARPVPIALIGVTAGGNCSGRRHDRGTAASGLRPRPKCVCEAADELRVEREQDAGPPETSSDSWIFPASFLAPAILAMVAVNVLPLVLTFTTSFEDYYLPRAAARGFNGIDNYVELFGDERFWSALLRTCLFAGVSLGHRAGPRFRHRAAPSAAAHRRRPDQGAAAPPRHHHADRRRFRLAADVQPEPRPLQLSSRRCSASARTNGSIARPQAMPALIAVEVWQHTPELMLIVFTGLLALPDKLVEAAVIDGASPWRVFWSIKLPLLKPIVMVGVLFRRHRPLQDLRPLLHPHQRRAGKRVTETLAFYVYTTGFGFLRMGYASAAAVVLFLLILAASCWSSAGGDCDLDRAERRPLRSVRRRQHGDPRRDRGDLPLSHPLALGMSLKTRVDALAMPPKCLFTPTFEHYRAVWSDGSLLHNARNSLVVRGRLDRRRRCCSACRPTYALARFDFPRPDRRCCSASCRRA